MYGGFGLTAHLPAGFDVFIQSSFGLLSLRAKEERVNQVLSPGGASFMQMMQPADLITEYVNLAEVNYVSPPTLPRQRQPYRLPFNYFSAELGIGYRIGE